MPSGVAKLVLALDAHTCWLPDARNYQKLVFAQLTLHICVCAAGQRPVVGGLIPRRTDRASHDIGWPNALVETLALHSYCL